MSGPKLGRVTGSRVKSLLHPNNGKSYLAASGVSLSGPLVVAVHENNSFTKQIENHLYLFDTGAGTWQRLLTQDGDEGYGLISPDNSHVVLQFEPKRVSGHKRRDDRLWLVELSSGQAKRLTTNDEEGTWDTRPTWRPDSEEIMFLRCRITQTGVTTKLMRVSRKGLEPTFLAEGVVDACYSPDGTQLAMVAGGGLQIWDPAKDERRLIVPWDTFPNHKYLGLGLTWSKMTNSIAFAITDQTTGESELWTVSSEGKDAKKIFSTKSGRISFPTFIQN
jgi:dipeptidyl aminopeptidase/acylaminoacyl peptidase